MAEHAPEFVPQRDETPAERRAYFVGAIADGIEAYANKDGWDRFNFGDIDKGPFISLRYTPSELRAVAAILRAALVAAPPAPQGKDGWQDISTAPKDGRDILVCGPFTQPLWRADCPAYVDSARWFKEQWTVVWMDGYGDPTHWRPLPAPPSGDQT